MITVIGVRFRTAGKVYYFAPGDIEFRRGEHAIVETARGVEYGFIVMGNREMEDEKIVQPLKSVIRKATAEDDKRHLDNEAKEKEALKVCKEKIQEHALEMKLIDVEYTFDSSKVLFYFTADGRVDFRALVKDLAAVFRTRIELRQVGVRDETKMIGGFGPCGRVLCCHSYLSEFAPVSIRMAKEQGLSLNPANISGVCGRLMCCLKNEEDVYEYLNAKLPTVGDYVTTPDELKGEVNSISVLSQTVKVVVNLENDEKELREYKVSELKFKPRRRKPTAKQEQGDDTADASQANAPARNSSDRPRKNDRRDNKNDRNDRGDKADKGDNKGERPDRNDRNENKGERGDRQPRPNKKPRSAGKPNAKVAIKADAAVDSATNQE